LLRILRIGKRVPTHSTAPGCCGSCLGFVGMALHHKLCHTLRGAFNLPHAETHTIPLPHAIAYNQSAASEALRLVADALGGSDAAQAMFDFTGRLGARRALKDLGMPESGIDQAADLAMENAYWNPQPLEVKQGSNLT